MKLEHVAGSKVPITDTDKMPDIDALILEKAEQLKQLCSDSKRQCLIVVDAKGSGDARAYSFWNLQMQTGDPLHSKEDLKIALDNLFVCVHKWAMAMTGGQVGIRTIYE